MRQEEDLLVYTEKVTLSLEYELETESNAGLVLLTHLLL